MKQQPAFGGMASVRLYLVCHTRALSNVCGSACPSRIQKVSMAPDPKAGCAGTLMNLLQEPRFNHETELVGGLLQEECAALLTQFFRRLRGRFLRSTDGLTQQFFLLDLLQGHD